MRPLEELNLTPEGYELGKTRVQTEFTLAPKEPIIPTLGDSGTPTEFRVGDMIHVQFKPLFGLTGYRHDEVHRRFSQLKGTIEKLIVENEQTVGFVLNREFRRLPRDPERLPSEIFWLNDIDPKDAKITSRPEVAPPAETIEASSIPSPDNSSPVMFPYGEVRNVQAPISVGDKIVFEFREDSGKIELENGLVTDIVRDPEGRPRQTHRAFLRNPEAFFLYPSRSLQLHRWLGVHAHRKPNSPALRSRISLVVAN